MSLWQTLLKPQRPDHCLGLETRTSRGLAEHCHSVDLIGGLRIQVSCHYSVNIVLFDAVVSYNLLTNSSQFTQEAAHLGVFNDIFQRIVMEMSHHHQNMFLLRVGSVVANCEMVANGMKIKRLMITEIVGNIEVFQTLVQIDVVVFLQVEL